ncbi:DUF3667 domain-containing protein [Colwellia sp. 12G3]|uniref:DUF3667 domain-containing protein n=1 Tax=Colwellia sp. 12G3 TaxID=2058299 RepID=UPI000C3238A1|nr:DUF3667 domain-containing protein [Colwellia sp. 12G3]PKI15913.1 hypothetical protein CXF71_12995 [Colwellia sp. 12G3]
MTTTELIETETATDVVNSAISESKKESKSCENCHQELNGPFCANCGQSSDSTLKYFWLVIMHLLDDIFSFDSRASRTIWPLITRPAFLTNEYFAGRRVHYVPPLRLYLFISIVFFITLKFFIASDDVNSIDLNGKQEVVTQVKAHIKQLKTEQNSLQGSSTESTEALAEITRLNEELAKFNNYLSDLNREYSSGQNKEMIRITRKLVELEFDKADEGLSSKEQERFETLVEKRIKVLNGDLISEELTIGNNEDGSLSFEFLSTEQNKKLNEFTEELKEKGEKAFNSDTGPLMEQVIGKLPQLMFILLPLFAVLLKVMFIFSKRLYMEHLTVALHSHSFIFITVLLYEMLDLLEDYLAETSPNIANFSGVVAGGLLVWIPIYLFLMQKRVYKQGKFFTFVKFSIIGTLYIMMIGVTAIVAMIWGIMGT